MNVETVVPNRTKDSVSRGFWKNLCLWIPTIWRLGPLNVIFVALYRLAIRCGLMEKLLPEGERYGGEFFLPAQVNEMPEQLFSWKECIQKANDVEKGWFTYFSSRKFQMGFPPDWFYNPLTGQHVSDPSLHWSRIVDFDSNVGDIKLIWELSRFDWAIDLAKAYRLTGKQNYLQTLNALVSDWTTKNPNNLGPNWKCGQETSIRMQQVLLTAFLLGSHAAPSQNLIRFVSEHCRRIAATVTYATAQRNNHGTSEAAALFVGGEWLAATSSDQDLRERGKRWGRTGRNLLEKLVSKLVGKSGSFSQYSLNYHRVLLDTLNLVEFWRRELQSEKFSPSFYERCRAAVDWLFCMVDPSSGDGPNLGANDGARLFNLAGTVFRDFRPSVQLGAALFLETRAYGDGPWNEPMEWLAIKKKTGRSDRKLTRGSKVLPDGGFVVFCGANEDVECGTWGMLRYPNFRFRPSHADAMHFDLWYDGFNLLRDSGSFQYNTVAPWKNYFGLTVAHNTVEFDDRNQMPRLSRFLFGGWPKMSNMTDLEKDGNKVFWSGTYRDYRGASHRRSVMSTGMKWKIKDEIEGYEKKAVLRWRLAPGPWKISGDKCIGPWAEIRVAVDRPVTRMEIATGWESRHYLEKNEIPVLEVEVDNDRATLITEISLLTVERK